MNIKISDITAYFINPDDYQHRRKAIEETLNSCGFKSIKRIAYNEKSKGKNLTMTNAHLYSLNEANINNDYPFVLYEDDARLMKELPIEFNIPEEADLIYLGGSNYSFEKRVKIEDYNKDFYRVYNMLSAHAILIPDVRGFNTIKKAYEDSLEKSSFNDIFLARASNSHIFLVPKEGNYFYQDDYTSSVTKFLWKDFKNIN